MGLSSGIQVQGCASVTSVRGLWASMRRCFSLLDHFEPAATRFSKSSLGLARAMPANKPPAKANSALWSRNLRQNNFADSDSDSEPDPPGREACLGSSEGSSTLQQPISEDARFMLDLDLSSRHDEAVFKPNPWSIAKVNAAVRPRPTASDAPLASKSSPKNHPKGQLVEAFKRQTERPTTASRKDSLRAPITSNVPGRSVANNVKNNKARNQSRKAFVSSAVLLTDSNVNTNCNAPDGTAQLPDYMRSTSSALSSNLTDAVGEPFYGKFY